jgi:glycosyltransferase involved in cell wall biosynthesis
MKIDIPILGFGKAGGYRVLSRLATEWKRMGHTVRIFSNQASITPYFPTEAEIVWLNDSGKRVAVNAPELLQHRGGIKHVAKNLCSLFLGLCRYSRSTDVILANHSLTSWPVLFCINKGRKFYYVQAFEAEFYAKSAEGRRPVLQAQAWLSYLLPLRRIVNAPVYLKYRNLRANAWVPPGVDFSLFKPRSELEPKNNPVLTLACIGRKEPDKGTRYVLEAFSILKAQKQQVRLRVAYGNIPDDMKDVEGIEVIVPANDGELAQFYRTADIFIAPALGQHGAPHYPVMEAMACGVPLITTGYLPATSENSWLVAEKDPVGIVSAINAILSGGAGTKAKVEKALIDISEFRWEAVAVRMEQVFLDGKAGFL